jgi:hypothetical protein
MNSKIIFSLLFVCMIWSSVFAQSKKKILKYKLKSITEYVTLHENGKELTYKESYILYNSDGKVLEETNTNRDGSIRKKETFKYDAGNNKTEATIYHKKEALTDKVEIENKRITFKYNANEEKTEEVEYDSNNKVTKKSIYTYNLQGEKSCEMCYDGEGKLKNKINYTYNSKSLKTKRETYHADNTLESVKIYSYEFY